MRLSARVPSEHTRVNGCSLQDDSASHDYVMFHMFDMTDREHVTRSLDGIFE